MFRLHDKIYRFSKKYFRRVTNEISIQLEPGQPMSCLVDDNFEVESREPRKWRFGESWFYQKVIKEGFHPKIIGAYGSTSWTWSAKFILAIYFHWHFYYPCHIYSRKYCKFAVKKLLTKTMNLMLSYHSRGPWIPG